MHPVMIRRAAEGDAEAIANLSEELGYPTEQVVMRRRINAVCTSAADLLIVGINGSGDPVAWLQAHAAHSIESGFRVEIIGLIVALKARRAGVGRALVNEAERWARSIGAGSIVVRSNIVRQESHAFYPTLGYAETKTQRVYRKNFKPTG